jgi:Trypsin-like peptidase domain
MTEPTIDAIKSIDILSFCVVPITPFFNDVELSSATGFLYTVVVDGIPALWLVSNWHVFPGRHIDPPNKALMLNGAIPNRIRFQVMKVLPGNIVQVHPQFANLYDADGKAIWRQHQSKSDVDIAALNLGRGLDGFAVGGINENARYDMKIEIGSDVFVLGYPLGFSHFISTPIWKRGSIASEPHAETPESRNRIMIDATTRSGMSGSPVVLREKTHYVSEGGEIVQHANASRFIGVYSSRPAFGVRSSSPIDGLDDLRTELGYVYKSGCIEQIAREGIPGPEYGILP